VSTQNSKDPRQWVNYAQQDRFCGETLIQAAGASEQAARPIALCAHQMIEHALKAVHIYKTHKLPKEIHDLPLLGQSLSDAGYFNFSEQEMDFLRLLHQYFMPLKYPQSSALLPSYEEAVRLFKDACELLARVEQQVSLP